MDSILDEIINIEKQAQDIMSEAKKAKQNIADELQKKQDEMECAMLGRADVRIGKIRNEVNSLLELKLIDIENLAKQRLSEMEQIFRENSDRWELEIFNNILTD